MSNHRLSESTRAHFTYRGDQLNEISFPLGGIGSGSIGLAGNGRLIDWEIFNRPNKGSINGFSHFAVKAERGGEVLDARVLHGDLTGPLSGSLRSTWLHSYGFGPTRASLGGLPHFADVEFEGTFPVATLSFADAKFPGAVSLRAFNPFIPGNSDDSSIPAACFEVQLANTSDDDLHYTVALALTNPAGPAKSVNRAARDGAARLLTLGSSGIAAEHPSYGDLTAATDCPEVSFQEYWFRGAWFDDLTIYWHDFTTPGAFTNRNYPEPAGAGAASGATTPGCWRHASAWPPGRPAACASCWPGASPTASTTGTRWGWSRSSATRRRRSLPPANGATGMPPASPTPRPAPATACASGSGCRATP